MSNDKKQTVIVPNEQGKNRYGLDMAYFRNLFNRELNRQLTDFRPDELARILARASRTADSEVLNEPEFRTTRPQAVSVPEGEPIAHVFPDDIKKLQSTECAVDAYSVEMGHPDRGETVPLYFYPTMENNDA